MGNLTKLSCTKYTIFSILSGMARKSCTICKIFNGGDVGSGDVGGGGVSGGRQRGESERFRSVPPPFLPTQQVGDK
jgi:hypothetical protein